MSFSRKWMGANCRWEHDWIHWPPPPAFIIHEHGYKSRVARLCLYRLTADGGCIMRQMRTYFNWNKSDTLNLNSFCNVILDIVFACRLYLCRIICKTGLQTETNMPFHQDIIMCMSHDEQMTLMKQFHESFKKFHETAFIYWFESDSLCELFRGVHKWPFQSHFNSMSDSWKNYSYKPVLF